MTADSLAYVTAVKGTVNSSYEQRKTLKEFVCDDLKRKGSGHAWLWILFALCFIGTSSFYSQLFFDLSALEEPADYFCLPKELKNTNWTINEIREVSKYSNSTQSCMALKLDYKSISKMSFGDALDMVNNMDELDGGLCSEIGGVIHVVKGAKQTFADDMDLLCRDDVSSIYTAFYKGCIFGGVIFGVIGDLNRKTAFTIAVLPYMFAAILPTYFHSSTVYMWSRFTVGFCGYGIINLLFVILIENSQRKLREIFAIMINLAVAFGMMWQYTISSVANDNISVNQTLLAYSTAFMVIFIKYLVDSPKHLISKRKYEEAYSMLNGKKPIMSDFAVDDEQPSTELSIAKIIKELKFVRFFCSPNYWHLTWLSLAIFCFWFFAFNYCDMKVIYEDFDSHIKMSTIYDVFGYIVTAFLVYMLPRKVLHISLAVLLGTSLIIGAALPSEELPFYQFLLTLCRSFGNPAIALFCLHIAEMFPTEIRSTAIGAIGSAGYLTGYYASSIVDFYHQTADAYNLPKFATMLGLFSIMISMLVYMLPETKKDVLKDSVHEKLIDQQHDDVDVNEKNIKEVSISSILFLILTVLCFSILKINFSFSF
ncbi:solute carrier family 22 member 27-like isoform X2 [Chironomus tepperi]|uniref:solute carrier family 22 member 27-like isoform X2 n=1 Tax=Chironomus tepperi TaxID=113505 RepID=UPI00391F33BB